MPFAAFAGNLHGQRHHRLQRVQRHAGFQFAQLADGESGQVFPHQHHANRIHQSHLEPAVKGHHFGPGSQVAVRHRLQQRAGNAFIDPLHFVIQTHHLQSGPLGLLERLFVGGNQDERLIFRPASDADRIDRLLCFQKYQHGIGIFGLGQRHSRIKPMDETGREARFVHPCSNRGNTRQQRRPRSGTWKHPKHFALDGQRFPGARSAPPGSHPKEGSFKEPLVPKWKRRADPAASGLPWRLRSRGPAQSGGAGRPYRVSDYGLKPATAGRLSVAGTDSVRP